MAKKSKKVIVDSIQNQQPNLFDSQRKFTEEQQTFIKYEGSDSVILAATAGSGKTYSCVERLKFLLSKGVNPERIIFFSFTKAATEELSSRIGNPKVKITTIHAFAYSVLARIGKFKNVATFYEFVDWYKKKYKPYGGNSPEEMFDYNNKISILYDESEFISSSISAFKLQMADNIKVPMPEFFHEYQNFLKETRSRDFADMLIEVKNAFSEDRWLNMFKNKYDYIFVDEYQDTSSIQMQVLLCLNADYYYLIGDRNQAIFSFSGTNCDRVEQLLKERRKTIEMSLTMNFRSDRSIIRNSNNFSNLKAKANSTEEGYVNREIILDADELMGVMNDTKNQVVVLVRMNETIRFLEFELLKRRYPIKYFNYITRNDMTEIDAGRIHEPIKRKIKALLDEKDSEGKKVFDNQIDIISFIKSNQNSNKFITSIHKSKGREFDICVVVNSIPPDLITEMGYHRILTKKQLEKITFDLKKDNEQKNIHYVAVSRSKHGLRYMIV